MWWTTAMEIAKSKKASRCGSWRMSATTVEWGWCWIAIRARFSDLRQRESDRIEIEIEIWGNEMEMEMGMGNGGYHIIAYNFKENKKRKKQVKKEITTPKPNKKSKKPNSKIQFIQSIEQATQMIYDPSNSFISSIIQNFSK
jgi:hypothetical protein